jgi:hypothetical protein
MKLCNQCGIGRLRPVRALYLTNLAGQVVVVPDAPAELCDVCGVILYDHKFVHHLDHLIVHSTGSDKQATVSQRRALSVSGLNWSPLRRST